MNRLNWEEFCKLPEDTLTELFREVDEALKNKFPYMECPYCGHRQEDHDYLEIPHKEWENFNSYDWDDSSVFSKTQYECEACYRTFTLTVHEVHLFSTEP